MEQKIIATFEIETNDANFQYILSVIERKGSIAIGCGKEMITIRKVGE